VAEFEPKIIAFACNWCSYAAADLAGTSRIHYPHNVRIVRVMCSGMIDPSHILRAFERGADGVIVAGCHHVDCHYIDGPSKCDTMFAGLKRLLHTLGLEDERLRRELISTSEGVVFAQVIQEMVELLKKLGPSPFKLEVNQKTNINLEDIIQDTKAYNCLECGTCSSVCPIARYDPSYSPRAMVENALLGLEDEIVYQKKLFSCLTCYACQLKCPSQVDYPVFIQKVRALATEAGQQGDNAHAGTLQSITRLMASSPLNQHRLEWLDKKDGYRTSEKSEVMLFTGCSPYFEPVFDDISVRTLDIAEASLKVLNFLGIEPLVHPDERCCGHDALWLGDVETFKKLAEHNAAIIKDSGVKKVIFFCPECYRTFKLDYPNYVNLDCEVMHISELLAQRLETKSLRFNEVEKKVTYQDSCRLGRHLGLYDAPRKVLSAIPGIELIEMEHSKEESICCGTSCFTNCDSYSKQIRVERLLEAKDTGAESLITSCPKCQIHFRCAMVNKGEERGPDIEIEVMDLVSLVASAIGD